MATLDNDFDHVNEADVPFIPTALRIGAIGGVISVIYALIGILTGLSNPGGGMMKMAIVGLIGIIITIGIVVYAIRSHRDNELGGHISLGRAFLVGLIASVVATLIGTIFNYVYMNFIDPSYIDTVIEGMEEMMASFNLPEEALETMAEETRASLAPGKMFTTGLLSAAAVGAVLSLICGAIMKKERPVA